VRPLIYLFDIDGTLVTTAGAGRKALTETFRQRYGSDHGLAFSFDGMTDKAIVALALEAMAVPMQAPTLAEEVERVLEAYVQILASLAQSCVDAFVIHEGVVPVLDRIQAAGMGVLGLGTGNVRRGAEIKLKAVNLYHRFTFGGFGCDHKDRTALLSVGATRGAALLGRPLGECDVLVIGDTPKDIAAAHGIGARCLAVATGSYSVEQLQAAGGDVCVSSLHEQAALAALMP
jgi:phosphoglycolate phosphatase-like HAD superfamily hydrolase